MEAAIARLPKFPPRPTPRPVIKSVGPAAPWVTRVPTDQPVAFITIDDGWHKLPGLAQLVSAARVPVTLFLSGSAIKDNTDYFRPFLSAGAVIEDHTLTHNNLVGRPYEAQRGDICGSADQLAGLYARRPVLFRPPGGAKDATTLQAAHDCGMRAVIFWTETVDKGIVRYQTGSTIRPGDILLMHFRPAFVEDFLAALNAIKASGLTPALLEDYIE